MFDLDVFLRCGVSQEWNGLGLGTTQKSERLIIDDGYIPLKYPTKSWQQARALKMEHLLGTQPAVN